MAEWHCDWAAGNDTTGDGSEGSPYKTIQKCLDVLSAGDKVWVKASASYLEQPSAGTAGAATNPVVVEGYTTTKGDGGQATIDAESTRNFCWTEGSSSFYVLRNLIMQDASAAGVWATGADGMVFQNCRITGAGAFGGVVVDNAPLFVDCEIDNNGGAGIDADIGVQCIRCKIHDNSGDGINASAGCVLYQCELWSNTGDNIRSDGSFSAGMRAVVLQCTIDGDGQNSDSGVFAVGNIAPAIFDSIIYDCAIGIEVTDAGSAVDPDALGAGGNNLVNGNGTQYQNWTHTTGDVTSAPDFVDEAGGDYRVNPGSPAIGAAANGMTIGRHQAPYELFMPTLGRSF